MKKVIYPGNFNSITKGHMNIFDQTSKLFNQVIVDILVNPNKKNDMFSTKERLIMIQELYQDKNKRQINLSPLSHDNGISASQTL